MKKKALGFIALAMAFLAHTATADSGAIRSIDPCDYEGNLISPGSIDSVYNVGETAYFRIRLENINSSAIYTTRNTTKLQNPWQFEYYLGGTVSDSSYVAQLWAMNPPKVGVYVSGRFTLATITSFGAAKNAEWFTDIICGYTVQPGDLALPMTLANSAGEEASDSMTTGYFLGVGRNIASPWKLISYSHESSSNWSEITATNECNFAYGNYWPADIDGDLPVDTVQNIAGNHTVDMTLFQAGLFLKSIDFDANVETDDNGNEVWRAVRAGSTRTKLYTPSLYIPGDVAPDFPAGTVYLWTADSNSVVLADAQYTIGSNRVYKMTYDGSESSLQFRLRGVTQGTSTELFLSSTLTNVVSGSGRTITNFVSRTVACIKPPSPEVAVLAGSGDGSASLSLNATQDYTNSTPFKVELTQAWTNDTEDVIVNLKYEVNGTEMVPTNLITLSNDQIYGYESPIPLFVTIPAKEVSSVELDLNPNSLYALGVLNKTRDKIVITPYFTNAAMAAYFAVKPCTLQITGMSPIVDAVNGFAIADLQSSTENSPLKVRGGVEQEFTIRVSDTYRNMNTLDGTNGQFSVKWKYDGGAELSITNAYDGGPLIPDGDGLLHVGVAYPIPAQDANYYTTVKVTNSEGHETAQSFYVFIQQPKNISATVETSPVGEGDKIPVTFTLSEPASSQSLYAFLEPMNEAASNKTSATFFTTYTGGTGVPFGSGATTAVSDALDASKRLEFFDNDSDVYVYAIRLCSTATWDPTARITEFTENTLTLAVTNNHPVIEQILSRNDATGVDKNTKAGMITMNVSDPSRTFRISTLKDVDADRNGTDANQIVYRWEIRMQNEDGTYPTGEDGMVLYTVGLNSTLSTTEIFGTATLSDDMCGTYRFKVRAQDKDMRGAKPEYLWLDNGTWTYSPERPGYGYDGARFEFPEDNGNDWGPEYTFELRIDKNPYIELAPRGDYRLDSDHVTPVYSESELLNGNDMGFTVALNAAPGTSGFARIPFEVSVEPVLNDEGVGPDTDVLPTITPTTFNFTRSNYSNEFEITGFDGTWERRNKGALYQVIAKVSDSNTGTSQDGTLWQDLYHPVTNYFRVENSAPTVTVDSDYAGQDSETNAFTGIQFALNEHFNFRWAVSDVEGDLHYTEHGLSNLVVTCSVVGGYEIGSVTNETEGSFSVWFTKPGYNRIKIRATDKDGDTGYSQEVWFYVAPSKVVYIYPFGPASASVGEGRTITKYLNAAGLGIGRVWADGNFGSIAAFMHTWTYGIDVSSAFAYAQGYAADEVDESTFLGNSIAPNMDGNGVGGTPFANTEESSWQSGIFHEYDNFFYRWFTDEPGKGGKSSSGSGSSSASSEWTAKAPVPSKSSSVKMELPARDPSLTAYPDTSALAVFSREWRVADNMGDINADGIPDKYAVGTEYTTDSGEVKLLCEAVNGGTVSGGESTGGGSDSASEPDLASLAAYNGDGDTFPAAANSENKLKPTIIDWGPGLPFKAINEIRGMHEGLNEPGVSDYDLSEAERYALFADCAAAGNDLSGTLEENYAIATNWAASTRWTPDLVVNGARLNPANADTDGDGFNDGWEYYFWYYAKVGAITNGVWGRLEGRRYSRILPATGTRIAPDEIVAAFNPLIDNGIGFDFDKDGLTDFEEYVLGTNPIDWDSDGDGMNDLWEVLNGLDPLSPNDAEDNPDRDFMARCNYAEDTFTVYTFQDTNTNEKVMFGLPTKTASNFAAMPFAAVTTNVYELVMEDDNGATNIYYTVMPAEYDDSATPPALTAEVEAFETVTLDGAVYLKSMVTTNLPVGAASVISVGSEAVDVSLVSAYYGADMVINSELKTAKIWFAEKPAVIRQLNTGLLLLAADTSGFMTYEHMTNTSANAKGVPYLGEEKVFPAGTILKAVAGAPVNITRARVPPFLDLAMFGKYGGFDWLNPESLERDKTPDALPLFNYGGDGKTYVPCSLKVDQFALAPVDHLNLEIMNALPVVKVERNHKVTLIHCQVMNQYEFDPRTAWTIDDYGYLDVRWRTEDSEKAASKGDAGKAVNTVSYTARDEYLVMQYRQQMRAIDGNGLRSETESLLNGGNGYLITDSVAPGADIAYFRSATTYPNFPVSFVRETYAQRQEVSPFENSTNRTIVAYWEWLEQEQNIHGADTDFDGVPDGWELYVNADPNNHDDGSLKDGWADDSDAMSIVAEYAGVDSCNAYTNRFDSSAKMIYPEADTITKNHPGRVSGWWNKFFPTNPYDRDTDGDGVQDDAEGKGWSSDFYVGNNWYLGQSFTFIYGREENAEKYDMDGTTICFRGGGLNPCTVDTDGDLLPDAWERQFAGVVFKDGAPENFKQSGMVSPDANESDIKILSMADGKQLAVPETGSVIRGGMDGTWAGDDSLDFDHDGLANCQEYLVQSLRHLRYDDPYTPLMGIHPATKEFLKFIPFSSWDGEAFHKKCLESGFTGLGTWKYSELGYFTLPPHKWDPLFLNTTGQGNCRNYADSEGAGYRIMLPPVGITEDTIYYYWKNGAMQYASTDPRRWDSDEDGMDDYWELFHGLNPLLGTAACPEERDEYDYVNTRFDVIASIHGVSSRLNAWKNYWTGWPTDRVQPAFDPIRFPWMMGTMECDADGDGLRNDEEAVKVNVAKPQNTHTDPSPLWMTDSTSINSASYTAQYYNPDPYISETPGYDPLTSYPDIFGFPWEDLTWYIAMKGLGMSGSTAKWLFAFEENEGYDTDHDFKRDAVELSGLPTNDTIKVEKASDPRMFTDPDRRQAIYFPGFADGVGSAAASRDGTFHRAVSDEPDMLKTFTVECWVKPDGVVSNAVIVERVCNYGASTLSNNTSVVRANFRIGVDDGGRPYGEFEGTTPNSGSARAAAITALEPNKWTHLAFVFDGSAAALYMNGDVAPVGLMSNVGLIPANGVYGLRQEYYTTVIPYGYLTLPCATVVGADAKNGSALALDEQTTWNDFGSYFKGWVDEIRVWDGARTPAEIHANYMKRLSMADIKSYLSNEEQTGVYDLWVAGARRSGTSRILPAELLQHYNFTTLPGGLGATNVLTAPPGFQANVLDNVRKPNGKSLDEALLAGWWAKTPVHSTVYWNYAIVPWIGNTVAHLPFMDGSTPDSQYWSSSVAGVRLAAEQGFTAYDYPNTANPYPYYFYRRDRFNRSLLLAAIEGYSETNTTASVDSLMMKWNFQLRSDFIGTSDLVPLGGAFARRDTDFWDGQGPMDAWAETAVDCEEADLNDNGIPDWAEQLGLTTAEAYLRALAEGLLPDGSYVDAFKSLVDGNFDGVPDWWQNMYGLSGSGRQDADKDGLADFAEYLVSEVFKFGKVDPTLARTNGKDLDYFLRPVLTTGVSKLYLGEMFSDHDFMEDDFEDEWSEIGADRAYYDAHLDSDEDGWSNWSEVRAKYDLGYGVNESGVKTNIVTETGPIGSVWWDYVEYKTLLKSLLDAVDNCVVLETDFTIVGRYSGTYAVNSDEGYYGTGYIKYQKIMPFYTQALAYRGTPQPEVTMTVRYNGLADIRGANLFVQAFTDKDLKQCDATFRVENGGNRNVNTVTFQYPASGHLREGKNTFVVFIGSGTNATYVAGNLFGVVRNVDVGWRNAAFEVELTEESPICPRPALPANTNGTSATTMAYVYRYAVDGFTPPSSLEYGPILVKDITGRSSLHEGDFLSDTEFDLDWSGFVDNVLDNVTVRRYQLPVTGVTYRVYFDQVDIDTESYETNSNKAEYVEFTRAFGTTRATAVPVAPGENLTVFYGARPTFAWRMEGDAPDSYTAFAIQVTNASGIVWNSGIQPAPVRNIDGNYQWMAPIYPNDQTSFGKVFTNMNNYAWVVTMYNSKYQSDEWSESRAFRMNAYAENEPNDAGYGRLNVKVKYFGPGSVNVSPSTLAGTLRVEAYTSPDFSGEPAGRTFVRDLTNVTNKEQVVNATIIGLKEGAYYVRAFIDSDGDFKRSNWESWGYACPRGDVSAGAIYAPTPVTVGIGSLIPEALVYVEDCDVDQDCLPDVYEYDEAGADKSDFLLEKGPAVNGKNGYIAVNPLLETAIRDLIRGRSATGLLTASPGRISSSVAALMLGVPTVEPTLDAGTLAITSLALVDGSVELTLGAAADDPAAGTVFVTDGMVRATVVVRYADALDGEWHSVEKCIEKKIEEGSVSETLTFSLEELGLDASKGFFKVELKQ